MRLKIFKLIIFFIFCFKNSESNNYYQKLSDFFSFKNNDSDNDKFEIKKKVFNFLKKTYGTVLAIYIIKAFFECNIDITKNFFNLILKVLSKNPKIEFLINYMDQNKKYLRKGCPIHGKNCELGKKYEFIPRYIETELFLYDKGVHDHIYFTMESEMGDLKSLYGINYCNGSFNL